MKLSDLLSDAPAFPLAKERSLSSIFRAALPTLGCVALLLLPVAAVLAAQEGPGTSLASQSMRPYAHVFWAYALAWALVLGWVISLARRWRRVEEELGGRAAEE